MRFIELTGPPGRLAAVAVLIAATLAGSAGAQTAPRDTTISFRAGMAAMQRGDHAEAERQFAGVAEQAPTHPIVLHQFARAQALAGHADASLVTLGRALRAGAGYDADRDSAFRSVWSLPGFAAVRRTIEARRRPVSTSRIEFRVAERDLVPEGIAYDPKRDRFLLGSLHKGRIVSVARKGRDPVRVPRRVADLPMPVVVGIKVDAARRRIWVAAGTNGATSPAETLGATGLFLLDADSGTILQAWTIGGPSDRHFFNDIAIGRDGAAWVSDTQGGAVYRAVPGADELSVVAAPGTHPFANGIALSETDGLLYVASGRGLLAVRLSDGAATPLSPDDPLFGVDGLVRHGRDLIAIQNVGGLARVVRLLLDPAGASVVRLDVLEANHPLFEAVPTTGTIVGSRYYYIANSQLNRLADDGSLPPGAVVDEPRIMSAPLRPASAPVR